MLPPTLLRGGVDHREGAGRDRWLVSREVHQEEGAVLCG